MRVLMVTMLCVALLLSGCGGTDAPLDQAMVLREQVLNSNGCSFRATVTADYGQRIYDFTMDCQSDKEGNLHFTVCKPDTIAGITGIVSSAGGTITFDDRVLAFQPMADGQLSPVTAPWIFIKTLRSGYMKACAKGEGGVEIYIDDTYAEDALHLKIITKDGIPSSSEIFWRERRVLTVTVENFSYL